MTPEQLARFFDHLDMVDAADKELDSVVDWEKILHRPSGTLQWTTSVRLNGRLGGGASVRLTTPASVWESNVYGQIEIRSAATGNRTVRLNPVEWKPLKPHHNPRIDNEEHSLATYYDRWHPYPMNRGLDVDIFFQKKIGIALPLPQNVTTFAEYLYFCGQVWKCPSMKDVPPPPWSPQLV
ncbi:MULTISPECIES: hypothetical protein [Rhizobium]|uniref:hypothetical protein n=1 Tax=Rhizobium TaxID=379 RepID=UPI001B32AFC8|nr:MULTISPECIES: hypothetical protein [Rhizobium]MBX4911218.1 hypothetical protein [Rhizobium bangladeshense]MBX5260335.1 hypothetical protein [Rhizobium sp. NLR16b]MBX5266425.1 hypothetical protein [Rhizobium sp. NLR16a]MBX5314993.1 hypothetical protein [Rhizobium sp. NLR11b]QTU98147.1 hypothetical protein J7U39_08305 [Rhizobium sp. NLR16a]